MRRPSTGKRLRSLPGVPDAIGGRRGADRPRPDREVPLLRTLGSRTGHHYRLQGPVRGYIPVGAVLTSERVFSSVFSSIEKAFKHSTTFGRNQLAMVAGLATLATFDEENIIERARWAGEAFQTALAPLVENYEMFHEVRARPHDRPTVRPAAVQSTAPAVQRSRAPPHGHLFADDGGTPVPPAPHLTQVAADNVNIVKLLPPLICGQEEIDYFVAALDDVLKDAHSGSGLMWEFGRTMAAGALRRPAKCVPGLRTYRRPRPLTVADQRARKRQRARPRPVRQPPRTIGCFLAGRGPRSTLLAQRRLAARRRHFTYRPGLLGHLYPAPAVILKNAERRCHARRARLPRRG